MNNLDPKSKLLNWELEELHKNAPRQDLKFKKNDRVKTPIGNMIVVDPDFSRELQNGEWVPKVRLGFITKSLGINKQKNHRFFTQDRLKILEY